LASTIIQPLEFLLILFTFIGNKYNRATIAKKTKERIKEENKATGDQ